MKFALLALIGAVLFAFAHPDSVAQFGAEALENRGPHQPVLHQGGWVASTSSNRYSWMY